MYVVWPNNVSGGTVHLVFFWFTLIEGIVVGWKNKLHQDESSARFSITQNTR